MQEDEINFEQVAKQEVADAELNASNFQGKSYLKNPEEKGTIDFIVHKVVESKDTTGKAKDSGVTFNIGLKNKKGEIKRYDIHTNKGIYTINSWEIYFKLFGEKGLLLEYASRHNGSFAGARLKITRNFDGQIAKMKAPMVAKLKDLSEIDAQKYIDSANEAIKTQTLYTIEQLN